MDAGCGQGCAGLAAELRGSRSHSLRGCPRMRTASCRGLAPRPCQWQWWRRWRRRSQRCSCCQRTARQSSGRSGRTWRGGGHARALAVAPLENQRQRGPAHLAPARMYSLHPRGTVRQHSVDPGVCVTANCPDEIILCGHCNTLTKHSGCNGRPLASNVLAISCR